MSNKFFKVGVLVLLVFWGGAVLAFSFRNSPAKVMQKLDLNKDNKLDKEEVASYKKGKLLAKFDDLDTDKDGFLTIKEMKTERKKKKM